MQHESVFDICKRKVNLDLLVAPNNTLCLDGPSCTKKSSILAATGRLVTKVQQLVNVFQPDNYPPSTFGYICAGVKQMLCGEPHFNDRSPLNVLDWWFLWLLLDVVLRVFGNNIPPNMGSGVIPPPQPPQPPSQPSSESASNKHHEDIEFDSLLTHMSDYMMNKMNLLKNDKIRQYIKLFQLYKDDYIRTTWTRDINCIAVVDSNIDRCDELRRQRNQGSDAERSSWKFYTFMQNLMYSILYPNLYIDLAWFDHHNPEEVVPGIAQFMNYALDHIVDRNRVNGTLKPAIISKHKLPVPKRDFVMTNMQIHVQRSIGRWGCAAINGEKDSLQELAQRIPRYLTVENIKHPDGNIIGPILSTTRDYLFSQQVGAMDGEDDDNENSDGEDKTNQIDVEQASPEEMFACDGVSSYGDDGNSCMNEISSVV